jgi:hypothetical protein
MTNDECERTIAVGAFPRLAEDYQYNPGLDGLGPASR